MNVFSQRLTYSKTTLFAFLLSAAIVLTFAGKDAYAQESGTPTPVVTTAPAAEVEETVQEVSETPTPAPVAEEVVVAPVVTPTAEAPKEEGVVVVEAKAAPEVVEEEEVEEEAIAKAPMPEAKTEMKWYDMITISPYFTARVTSDFLKSGELGAQINSSGVKVKAVYGPFELMLVPEFRQTKNRSFLPSNIVLKEAFIKWNMPVEGLSLKGGLVYNQFGMFWDDSFFGNEMLLFGYKLNADYNIEVALDKQFTSVVGLKTWFQLSPGQDGTDLSVPELYQDKFQTAGDFEATKYFKTMMALRFRLLPSFTFGDFKVEPGISVEYKLVDREASGKNPTTGTPTSATMGSKDVIGKTFTKARGSVFAADTELSLYWKKFRWTTEFMGQFTDPALSFNGKKVKRFFIANSLHAPLYDAPKNEWFSNVALNLGLSYSILQTEELNRLEIFAGFTTQLYKYIDIQVEYGRYWNVGGDDVFSDQMEFLLTAKY